MQTVGKQNRVSLTVSGVGSLTWHASPGGQPLAGCSQSLLHLYLCSSCRKDTFWAEGFVGGLMFPSLRWKSSHLATGSGHFSLYSSCW